MIDLKSIKPTRLEEAEITAGLSSWAHAHLFIMRIDDADLALKTLKYAIDEGKGRDMVRRILHRYLLLYRHETTEQVWRVYGRVGR